MALEEHPSLAPPGPVSTDRLATTIGFFAELLGRVIREQAGDDTFALQGEVLSLAKEVRAGGAEPLTALRAIVARTDVPKSRDLLRAFSTYFALVNLAEQLQRGWVLRD